MNRITLSLLALALFFTAPSAYAQRVTGAPSAASMLGMQPAPQDAPFTQGIVAVVNDSIISSSDLRARMGLAILSAGMPDSPEVQRKLMPQVLRSLIDEQLQLQEGKKQGVTVSAEEISKAMAQIAQDNRLPGDMTTFLRAKGISPTTLKTQIKATITWNRVIAREIRPRIDIGDDEIDSMVQRMRSNAGKQEYLVSEIFLAADKPSEEEQVKVLADKLVEQIKSGVVFGAAARQFSQGLGAGNGGDIGWIQIGQLAPEIDRVLPSLKVGEVAGPIRSSSGYHILGLREKRTIALGNSKDLTVKLEQLFRPFGLGADKDSLIREARNIRQNITSCTGLQKAVGENFPLWKWQDLGNVKLDKAPTWLAEKVANIPDGQASDPMATDKGALVIFVCGRTADESIDREALRNSIGTEKMELLARRLLRDLRKSAYIDVRLKG